MFIYINLSNDWLVDLASELNEGCRLSLNEEVVGEYTLVIQAIGLFGFCLSVIL